MIDQAHILEDTDINVITKVTLRGTLTRERLVILLYLLQLG